MYNYLGLSYTPKGVWTATMENLSASAMKATFSLKKIFSRMYNLPVSNMLQIYDAKILPILTYGSELWGAHPQNCVAKVYNNFHKYVLGLPLKSVNIVAIGELGRPSIRYFTVIKMINYWLRVITHDDNRFTKNCYLEQVKLADNNVRSWGLSIKNTLCSMGFGFAWFNQGVESESNFLSLFKQRLIDIDRQAWTDEIVSIDLLRTYKIIKTENYLEPYSIHLENIKHRRAISMLRCCCLQIGIHKGRKLGIPLSYRICTFCNLDEIDDEFHFILVCPFIAEIRQKYIPRYYIENRNEQTLKTLLDHNYLCLCKPLSKFVIDALEKRYNNM